MTLLIDFTIYPFIHFIGVVVGGEEPVDPLLGLCGDGVEVGIEEDGGQGGVGA